MVFFLTTTPLFLRKNTSLPTDNKTIISDLVPLIQMSYQWVNNHVSCNSIIDNDIADEGRLILIINLFCSDIYNAHVSKRHTTFHKLQLLLRYRRKVEDLRGDSIFAFVSTQFLSLCLVI
ncbi:hypothetical protein QVD17_28296 [Tagetes erecta]|uniref:Uncharacterized protein n=1 Tax=Tagetes erecta TaxID=13708 RepID=A0AAD8KCK2_TARER|nr:hypothetical protein QVD17_28296 [Tagetes erecta]